MPQLAQLFVTCDIGDESMSRRRKGTGDQVAKAASRAQRRRRPPWGGLLGGKAIERQAWMFGERTEWDEQSLRAEQYSRMLRLKKYYGIAGGENLYPIEGVGPTDWLPWYELALRIASDLDESLNFVDAPPPAKTAARWRGPDGLFLVRLVDSIQENRPKAKRSIRWCLQGLRKRLPGLEKMSIGQLEARYYEAKKSFAPTKQAPKQKGAS
jgi:hypothetical protein